VNRPILALRRSALLSLSALVVLAVSACAPSQSGTDADGSSGGGTVAVTDGVVEITAADLQFDANVIQAPAGEAFTITLVNNDSAPHNISVYTEQDGEEIVIGDVIDGGETIDVEVPALDAGEYYFVCDIHPDMNGSVVVEG